MDMSETGCFSGRIGTRCLSQALRLGAHLRPQSRGGLFKDGGSCALGAIYEASFDGRDEGYFAMLETLLREYPELENEYCEIPGRARRTVIREIFTRNDRGDTREAIAEWLETLGY